MPREQCKRAWGNHPTTPTPQPPCYPTPSTPPFTLPLTPLSPLDPTPLPPTFYPYPTPTPITQSTTLSLIMVSGSHFTTPYQSEHDYHMTLSQLIRVKGHNTVTMSSKYLSC